MVRFIPILLALALLPSPAASAQASSEPPITVPQPPPATVPLDQLSIGHQRLFERQAENYLRAGDSLWSIEVWLRIQRSASESREALAPYASADAPIFYDPLGDRRVQKLNDLHPQASQFAIVYGKVIDKSPQGALVLTRQGLVYVYELPDAAPTDSTGRVLLITRPDGQMTYKAGDQMRSAPAVRIASDAPLAPVSPAQLCEWVQQNKVERFEQWRYKKVWDRDPTARTVYVGAENKSSPTDAGGRISAGSSEPVEVVTDSGEFHYEWTRGGPRVPVIRAPQSTVEP